MKTPAAVLALYTSHFQKVGTMLNEVSIEGVRQKPRVEPTFVLLVGGSGLGKSLITPIMACDFLKEACDVERTAEWSRYIFNRTCETVYWEGYTNQKVIVYDEFNQVRDSAGTPNPEIMELFRLGNSAPYIPPMARCEAKGKTKIQCEFVMMSSNTVPTEASVQSIHDPSAFLRRIENCVEVSFAPKYMLGQTGVPNYDLIVS